MGRVRGWLGAFNEFHRRLYEGSTLRYGLVGLGPIVLLMFLVYGIDEATVVSAILVTPGLLVGRAFLLRYRRATDPPSVRRERES